MTANKEISLSIPPNHFVVRCDLDDEKPWCEVVRNDDVASVPPKRLLIPVELALYLKTHWCGSKRMHEAIKANAIRDARNAIKEALRFED